MRKTSTLLASLALVAISTTIYAQTAPNSNLEAHVMVVVTDKNTGKTEKYMVKDDKAVDQHKAAEQHAATLFDFSASIKSLGDRAVAMGKSAERKIARVAASKDPMQAIKDQAMKAFGDVKKAGAIEATKQIGLVTKAVADDVVSRMAPKPAETPKPVEAAPAAAAPAAAAPVAAK